MPEEERANLVQVLARTYSVEQLDVLVKRALGKPLQYYAIAPDLLTVVDKLLSDLELTPTTERLTFLLNVREWCRQPLVRGAIDAYLGLADSSTETYEALVVFEEPFVDRQLFRDKLRDLFQNQNRRALVARGPRACGKSHTRWLVQHVARSEGFQSIFVDLQDIKLDEIVSQLINEMNLPPKDFRDRLAQFAAMSKGFVTALRGICKAGLLGQRWCIVFDSYDSDRVGQELREFVDILLADIGNLQMDPVWIIILGHRQSQTIIRGAAVPLVRVIADDIQPVLQSDVAKFLKDFSVRAGVEIADEVAASQASEIFGNLSTPLDLDGMMTMKDRLREKLSSMTGGVR